MSTTLLLFVLYLTATIAIGLWAARRGQDDAEDYFLGGRRLGGFTMALSAVSSGRSAWLVVGASAAAWSLGLSALWLFPGYIVAEALLFIVVGPALRRSSGVVGAITVPEVLQRVPLGPDGQRGTSRLPIQPLAGLISCAFLLTYVSAQLGAGAKTLGATFDIDGGTWGLFVTAGIVLVYTLLGGYRAVVVTDVLQAVLMLFGMVVLPTLALVAVGGVGALFERLEAIDPELVRWSTGALAAVGGLCIGFGSPGNPHILVRHMSLRDPREARTAMWTGTFWNVVMALGALLLGLTGRALYSTPEALGGGAETLYATLAQDLCAQYLFPGFVGLLLATLFAAVMSTCDSQLLVIASSFVRDFRRRSSGGRAASRAAVALTLAGAVALTWGELPIVNNLVLLSWSALGASFGPAVLLTALDARTTARGVLAGILIGAGSIVCLWWFAARPAGKHLDYELGLAFAASTAAIWALRRRDGKVTA